MVERLGTRPLDPRILEWGGWVLSAGEQPGHRAGSSGGVRELEERWFWHRSCPMRILEWGGASGLALTRLKQQNQLHDQSPPLERAPENMTLTNPDCSLSVQPDLVSPSGSAKRSSLTGEHHTVDGVVGS